ncbi:MAG: LCP family protein, partial [Candidatus Kapabacteria bacterium]|nr:LCP family protein [Candidatus Kapabacteria bacterium]MDW8225547.1 LCP family protein [Bacteroidota bacterium]
MSKGGAWRLSIGLLLLGGIFLWLYSHKLWTNAEERRLDSLLRIPPSDLPVTKEDSPDLPPITTTPEPQNIDEMDTLPTLAAAWGTAAARPPRCHNCVAIAIIGIDSRLNDPTPHADANHVLLIELPSGRITIVAIPRDTPADAGFPDTSQFNKLTNVRAHRGLQAHLTTLAQLVGIPAIHYYAEISFSQAFALLRLLRFENPSDVLRILRARTGIWEDDYHRVYTQAQFIRQQILRWFDSYDTPWGLALLRGALSLVRTNLTVGVLTRLADSLHVHGFPADAASVPIVVY